MTPLVPLLLSLIHCRLASLIHLKTSRGRGRGTLRLPSLCSTPKPLRLSALIALSPAGGGGVDRRGWGEMVRPPREVHLLVHSPACARSRWQAQRARQRALTPPQGWRSPRARAPRWWAACVPQFQRSWPDLQDALGTDLTAGPSPLSVPVSRSPRPTDSAPRPMMPCSVGTTMRASPVPPTGEAGFSFPGGGGSIEPSAPPPKKGSIHRTPKILPRLTPGPRR